MYEPTPQSYTGKPVWAAPPARGGYRRVSGSERCPICQRDTWCMIAGPSESPTAAICPRTEAGSARYIADSGYLHRLRDDPDWRDRRIVQVVEPEPDPHERHAHWSALVERYRTALSPGMREAVAHQLGVSDESLARLGIGYDSREYCPLTGSTGALTFPMHRADGMLCGIAFRMLVSGEKKCVTGSRLGLFAPPEVFDATPGQRLFISEGASDNATLLDFGFLAVGRASCTASTTMLTELVRRQQFGDAVIVADSDPPGQRGAHRLAAALAAIITTRVIYPPPNLKDVRQYRVAGGTAAGVLAAVEAAAPISIPITISQGG
jgi:hypothetical protein